ncbi:hypothetical protein B0H14DRAFT_2642412 [Mycena olivaceomarginata]|nr:hypothetical protein B0H14DRAFT_2642412 [Mycena olivaceomarginata]
MALSPRNIALIPLFSWLGARTSTGSARSAAARLSAPAMPPPAEEMILMWGLRCSRWEWFTGHMEVTDENNTSYVPRADSFGFQKRFGDKLESEGFGSALNHDSWRLICDDELDLRPRGVNGKYAVAGIERD